MSIDEQHCRAAKPVRRPSLRPTTGTSSPPRTAPSTPDELPLEAHQTDEEREFTSTLPARAYAPGGVDLDAGRGTTSKTTGSLSARFVQPEGDRRTTPPQLTDRRSTSVI